MDGVSEATRVSYYWPKALCLHRGNNTAALTGVVIQRTKLMQMEFIVLFFQENESLVNRASKSQSHYLMIWWKWLEHSAP